MAQGGSRTFARRKVLKQRQTRWERKARDRLILIKDLRRQLEHAKDEYRQHGKKRRPVPKHRFGRYSIDGGYKLALKSRMTYGGNESSLQMLQVSGGRHGVAKWEALLGQNLRAQAIDWHAQQYAAFDYGVSRLPPSSSEAPVDDAKHLSFDSVCVRCDATNVPALQQYKAHTLEVKSGFNLLPYALDTDEDAPLPPSDNEQTFWAPLMKVPTSCGGKECKAMIVKQLQSLGVATWLRDDDRAARFSFSALPQNLVHLRLFMFITDKGPDQRGAQTEMLEDVAADPYTLLFRQYCVEHGLHLEVSDSLNVFPSHFSQVAKMCHVWRAGTTATSMKTWFAREYGEPLADKTFKKLPPRPLRGRWGCIHASEEFFLNIACNVMGGPEHFRKMWEEVVRPVDGKRRRRKNAKDKRRDAAKAKKHPRRAKANAKSAALPATVAPQPDDGMDDGIDEMRKKLGRWKEDTMSTVADEMFWLRMQTLNITREPLEHLRHWLQSTLVAADARRFVQFVTKEIDIILDEWQALLDGKPALVWKHIVDVCDDLLRQRASADAVLATLNIAAGYVRRVYLPTMQFPELFVWICASPPTVPCGGRQAMAEDLLGGGVFTLDQTSSKIVKLFARDLEHMRDSGCCSEIVWIVFDHLCSIWALDTAPVEGRNNVVKAHIRSAPSISWRLLSHRLMATMAVGALAKRQPQQQIDFENLVSSCVAYHATALQMHDGDLFDVVHVDSDDDVDDVDAADARDVPTVPTTTRERRYAARLLIAIKEDLPNHEFVIGTPAVDKMLRIHTTRDDQIPGLHTHGGGDCWLAVKTFNRSTWVARVRAYPHSIADLYEVVVPYQIFSLIDVLENVATLALKMRR